MFIETETTPNPATLKFLPGRQVMPAGTREFTSPEEAEASPLAEALFDTGQVTNVFYGRDFVSVTAAHASEWSALKPQVVAVLLDHFVSEAPLFAGGDASGFAVPAEQETEDDPAARRFVMAVLIAFLPAMVLGAGLHGIIKAVLFNPTVVSIALILGGVAILLVERLIPVARYHQIENFPAPLALKIGFCQCLALVPGVSRSGASILGALLMGVDRKTAAEFSFFLAVPTMAGATVYDLYKNWSGMSFDSGLLILVGFITAFIAAALVVKTLVDFVGRYGFTPFGWYRIAIGTGMLAFLYL